VYYLQRLGFSDSKHVPRILSIEYMYMYEYMYSKSPKWVALKQSFLLFLTFTLLVLPFFKYKQFFKIKNSIMLGSLPPRAYEWELLVFNNISWISSQKYVHRPAYAASNTA
jgi:hypothetical protein